MNFKKQIKSPKWQKRRLEILNRDNFTCQSCGSTDETLHVHHIKYNKDKMYWEYPDDLLITLCEECHSTEHLCQTDFLKMEIENFKDMGFTYIEICGMLSTLRKIIEETKGGTPEEVLGKPISYYIIGDASRIAEWRKRIKHE